MTREDIATSLSMLGAGSLQVLPLASLQEAFGSDPEKDAAALAAEYGCHFHMDTRHGEGVFDRPLGEDARAWGERERAAVDRSHPAKEMNVIPAEDERKHLTQGTGDAAKRPLEQGGEAENPHPRAGSSTDPDAG